MPEYNIYAQAFFLQMNYFNHNAEYSNQFHQLLITPSRRFSVTFDGTFQKHSELLKISLKKLNRDDLIPIVHFVLRDKFSGVFYAETVTFEKFPPIEEFLFRAWSLKGDYFFAGLPEYLSVPKYAISDKLSLLLNNLNITEIQPRFNDEAGVIAVKIMETELLKYKNTPFADLQGKYREVLAEINHFRTPNQYLKTEKYDRVWLGNIDSVVLPPELKDIKRALIETVNYGTEEIFISTAPFSALNIRQTFIF